MEWIKQKLEETRKRRELVQHVHAALSADMLYPPQRAFGVGTYRLFHLKGNMWRISEIAVVIASVIIAWLIGSGHGPVEWLHNLDLLESNQVSSTESPADELLETHVTGVTERVDKLTDSILNLESGLMHARGITDSIIDSEQKIASMTTPEPSETDEVAQILETLPSPAAGQTRRGMSIEKIPRQTPTWTRTRPKNTTGIAAITVSKTAIEEQKNTVIGIQPAVSMTKQGPWVINIASLPSKADAERFAENVRTMDIETEQQHVTVKGKEYWRVQITGFSTAAEAKATAGTTMEKLGLKEIWITKH